MKLNIWNIILAVFLPPAAVWVIEGFSKHFWLNILLSFLGYIPGLVHALIIILPKER